MKRLRNKTLKRAARLGVQQLENRQLMAADIGLADGMVSIRGTAQDDVAEVYADSGSIIVQVTTYDATGQELGADSKSYDESEVNGIVFQAGDGDDLFVNDTNIDSITRSGGGNDTVLGGGGNDILAMGVGNDIALGGGGDDIILAGPGDDVVVPALEDESQSANDALETGADDIDDGSSPVDELLGADEAEDDDLGVEDDIEESAESESVDNTVPPTGGDLEETELLDNEDPIDEETDSAATDSEQTDSALDDHEADTCSANSGETIVDISPSGEQSVEEDDAASVVQQDLVTEDADDRLLTDVVEEATSEETDDAPSDDQPEDLSSEGPIVGDNEPVDASPESSDHDMIFGGDGDDVIFGEDGNDLIFGGSSAVDDALLRMVIASHLGQ